MLQLKNLKASDIPHPESQHADEVKVVRERDQEGFMVAKGSAPYNNRFGQRRHRIYYTIRNDTAWQGYKTADSIADVRAIIGGAP